LNARLFVQALHALQPLAPLLLSLQKIVEQQ